MKNKFLISILLSLLMFSNFAIAEENNEYSVGASIYPEYLETPPCGIATYDIIVTNSGEETDTYYLDVTGIPKEWFKLTHDSVTLDSEESKTVYLFVTADCYSKENVYSANISILGKSDTSVNFVLKVKPDRILEIKAPDELLSCICEDSTSKIVVENKGKYDENVLLYVDPSNYTELSENRFLLKPNESKEVELLVKAMCDDEPGIKMLALTTKSENSYAYAEKNIQAERLNCHDFSLNYNKEVKVCSGEPTVLEIEIKNTGTKNDIFTVSIDDLNYSETVSIDSGSSEKVSTVLTVQEEKEMEVRFLSKSSYKSELGSFKVVSEKCYGVDLKPESNEITIESGKGVLLRAVIKNLGIKQDSFSIYSDASWAAVRPKSITLEGNETNEAFAYYSPEYGALGVYETTLTAESEKSKDVETIRVNIVKEGVEATTTTLSEETTTTTQMEAEQPKLLQNKSFRALIIAILISLIIFAALYFFVMKGD